MMPEACARALGCRYSTIPIQPAIDGFDAMLAEDFADAKVDTTEENIQSRIRGVTLMALSNKFGPMLLTTGNKSEMSVGYATIYGDMAGGYNPLKDAYKMTVFGISKWRNTAVPKIGLGPAGEVIPQAIIDKPPSAELRPDQKDEDLLPPYPVLDRILMGLVEHEKSVDQLVGEGHRAGDGRTDRAHAAPCRIQAPPAPPGVKLGMRTSGATGAIRSRIDSGASSKLYEGSCPSAKISRMASAPRSFLPSFPLVCQPSISSRTSVEAQTLTSLVVSAGR